MSVVATLGVAAIACVIMCEVAQAAFLNGWAARSRLDGPGDPEPPVPSWLWGLRGLGLVLAVLTVGALVATVVE